MNQQNTISQRNFLQINQNEQKKKKREKNLIDFDGPFRNANDNYFCQFPQKENNKLY